MTGDAALWRSVAADIALIREAAEVDATDVAAVGRLRRGYDAERVTVALELAAARRAAAVKFPGEAERIVADREGVEQATSLTVARHKARRWRDAGVTRVVDLCCGIGGDAMGLMREGLAVVAADRDPVRAWMAGRNAGCAAVLAEVGEAGSGAGPFDASVAVHLDPTRRTGAGRVYRLAEHDPAPAVVRSLLARHADTAVKLSPAVDLDELEREYGGGADAEGAADVDPSVKSLAAQPTDLHPRLPGTGLHPRLPGTDGGRVEVEFISEAGRLVQAVRWSGRPARASRGATLLRGDEVHELYGEPGVVGRPGGPGEPGGPCVVEPRRYLFTVDPAVERAGLMHRLGLPVIHPKLGLFTADAPVDNPWLTGFELLGRMPYRLKRVKAWLREHDGGIVEVKTRGRAVDPDAVQRDLRGTGATTYTVFALRFDRQVVALVTRRLG